MGSLHLAENYQMSDMHRSLLNKARIYLVHNIRPTESLWSMFISKEVLSYDMIDEIKARVTTSEKIGLLLDYLPYRGPDAFDCFCEALLECDHSHVADYLKTLEATDKFRSEISPHCTDFSDHAMERFVSIFKRNTPMVQRFAERKFELILKEQELDLRQRESEVRELEGNKMMLQLEVTQLRSFLNTCFETSENISGEVSKDFITRSFLTEEKKHLDNLKGSLQGIEGFEKVVEFYSNMQNLLDYLGQHAGMKVKDPGAESTGKNRKGSARMTSSYGRTIHDKLQRMANEITELSDDLGSKVQVRGHEVRDGLAKILHTFEEISQDVFKIRDTFKSTLREKRKLEGEVLSLLHNFQEIRRLEREQKEKQSHIADLKNQGQLLKKKTKQRKQFEQVQQDIEGKKAQMAEIQKHLQRHSRSADIRMSAMLQLLPDLDDPAFYRSDTEVTPSEASMSRPGSYGGFRLHSAALRRRESNGTGGLNSGGMTEGVNQAELDKLHEKVISSSSDDENKEKKDKKDNKDKSNNTNTNTSNDSPSMTRKTDTNNTTNKSGTNSTRLLSKRQRQAKTVPVHMRLSAIKSKNDNKQEEEVKKSSGTKIDGMNIDEWLEKQQETLRLQDEKLKEQQKKIAVEKAENERVKAENERVKAVNEEKLKKDENGNAIDNKTTSDKQPKDINSKDINGNPRQPSAEGSEKEKGWFEANKGSASSRSTGSRPPSASRSKPNDPDIENDPTKETDTDTTKDARVPLHDFRYPDNQRLHQRGGGKRVGFVGGLKDSTYSINPTQSHQSQAQTTDSVLASDRNFSPSKRIRSRTTEGATNVSVMNGDGIGLMDPGASKLKQSFSNMVKELTDMSKTKSRQSLPTNRVELRLPSK